MTSRSWIRPGLPGALLALTLLVGCGPAPATPVGAGPTTSAATSDRARLYAVVLRHFLTHDTSFPGTFALTDVMDVADDRAADPMGGTGSSTEPIAPADQTAIAAALADLTRVVFVADRASVLDTTDGCAQVRDHGILVQLGRTSGTDRRVEVPVNGFVACLGAVWLTYVVERVGGGWTVTGTTGTQAIA